MLNIRYEICYSRNSNYNSEWCIKRLSISWKMSKQLYRMCIKGTGKKSTELVVGTNVERQRLE